MTRPAVTLTLAPHPLVERLLRKSGASPAEVPSLEAWQTLLTLVSRTYQETDQERYALERSAEISSREMRGLYQELERKNADELAVVRQSSDRHRLLFDRNPIPVWLFDNVTRRYLDVNEAACALYGYTRAEMLAMKITDINVTEEHGTLAAALEQGVVGDVRHFGIRKHRRKDGAILELDITGHHVQFENRRRCPVRC